jgi:hypothetical protein
MVRRASTGDTVLVKNREMTDRTQTLPWGPGEKGLKTTENKIHWPRCVAIQSLQLLYKTLVKNGKK